MVASDVFVERICPFRGKKANKANMVSFSNHRTKKLHFVNLQYKRVLWEAGKRYLKLRLSTKALKTIERMAWMLSQRRLASISARNERIAYTFQVFLIKEEEQQLLRYHSSKKPGPKPILIFYCLCPPLFPFHL